MIYIYILLGLYITKTIIVYRLRNVRDNLNIVSNYSDKLKCRRLNETIDILTGGWILKLKKRKSRG